MSEVGLQDLLALVKILKKTEKKIVLTQGSFDMVHLLWRIPHRFIHIIPHNKHFNNGRSSPLKSIIEVNNVHKSETNLCGFVTYMNYPNFAMA